MGVLVSDIVFAACFESSLEAEASFLRRPFVADLCLSVAVGCVT